VSVPFRDKELPLSITDKEVPLFSAEEEALLPFIAKKLLVRFRDIEVQLLVLTEMLRYPLQLKWCRCSLKEESLRFTDYEATLNTQRIPPSKLILWGLEAEVH
jgi:hypothetical protein